MKKIVISPEILSLTLTCILMGIVGLRAPVEENLISVDRIADTYSKHLATDGHRILVTIEIYGVKGKPGIPPCPVILVSGTNLKTKRPWLTRYKFPAPGWARLAKEDTITRTIRDGSGTTLAKATFRIKPGTWHKPGENPEISIELKKAK